MGASRKPIPGARFAVVDCDLRHPATDIGLRPEEHQKAVRQRRGAGHYTAIVMD